MDDHLAKPYTRKQLRNIRDGTLAAGGELVQQDGAAA